jgi:hypothetical protein
MSATTVKINLPPGGHGVHFYEDDRALSRTVGAYLADGLDAGAAAVVIAAGAHIEAIEEALALRGIDVEEARDTGALVILDAAATLAALTPGGGTDREIFQEIVGGVLRQAADGDRPVRAYGEMVDLLWQAGEIATAIELEKLWNELIEELRFSLLCAYHSEAAQAPEHRHALGEVCRLHSSVSGTSAPEEPTREEVSREFEPERGAPRDARRFVEEVLQGWDHWMLLEDARLLLSELVTNAVTHAHSPFSVSIRRQRSGVRLAVHDRSPAEPTLRPLAPDADSGRGLQIVAALAKDWGVLATPVGKTVWAEL